MKVPPLGLPLNDVREELDKLRHPLSIAVLRAKNPFNVGAIIRTAHSFLVREIFLIGDAPFYERAAMGMDKYENIVKLPTERSLIDTARARGLPLVVLEKDHARENLWTTQLPSPCLMVFGNEDDGVGPELIEAADQVVGIPMFGINHSFPVSIASGIAMGEWTRRYVTAPENLKALAHPVGSR